MVSIIIIAHAEIANSFAHCVEHILSRRVANLHIVAVKKSQDIDHVLSELKGLIEGLLKDKSVLLLTDLFGATPSNIAKKLVCPGKVEMLTGLNMPMLIRAITHTSDTLNACVKKALEGGVEGILYLNESKNDA